MTFVIGFVCGVVVTAFGVMALLVITHWTGRKDPPAYHEPH